MAHRLHISELQELFTGLLVLLAQCLQLYLLGESDNCAEFVGLASCFSSIKKRRNLTSILEPGPINCIHEEAQKPTMTEYMLQHRRLPPISPISGFGRELTLKRSMAVRCISLAIAIGQPIFSASQRPCNDPISAPLFPYELPLATWRRPLFRESHSNSRLLSQSYFLEIFSLLFCRRTYYGALFPSSFSVCVS